MPTLRYPQKKIQEDDDWMKIDIYQYKPGTFSESFNIGAGGLQGSIIQSILLPIPVNLPANTLMTPWGSEGSKINPLEVAGMNVASTAVNAPENLGKALTNLIKDGTKALSSANGIKGSTIAVSAAAVQQLGGNLTPGQALSRFAGITFNENVELTFNGVQLRGPSSFQFTLTPRNEKEKEIIRQIILSLKENMTPSQGTAGGTTGIFLNAPNVFQISYKKGRNDHPFLNKFKVTALQALSVNFTPQNYATYEDGTPVSVILDLQFQELTPIYKENYENASAVGY